MQVRRGTRPRNRLRRWAKMMTAFKSMRRWIAIASVAVAAPMGPEPDAVAGDGAVLSLGVNVGNGAVRIENTTGGAIAINSYRITSPSGSLDPGGWDAIAVGPPIVGFPQGDGSGNGWEAGPNVGGGELVEWYLAGSSQVNDGAWVDLGAAFVPIVVPLVGDYNDDRTVDAADYVVWRKNEGTANGLPNDPAGGVVGAAQYDNWRSSFGRRGGVADLVFEYTLADGTVVAGDVDYSAPVGAAIAPEPGAASLVLMGGCTWLVRRQRRGHQRR